jgi:hypothetical protein
MLYYYDQLLSSVSFFPSSRKRKSSHGRCLVTLDWTPASSFTRRCISGLQRSLTRTRSWERMMIDTFFWHRRGGQDAVKAQVRIKARIVLHQDLVLSLQFFLFVTVMVVIMQFHGLIIGGVHVLVVVVKDVAAAAAVVVDILAVA